MSLNHIVLQGRLTRDPELRRTGSGVAVASFTIAVDRDYNPKDAAEKEVDFIDCNAWRGTGEFVSKYFTKGSMAIVSGRLQIRTWTDKDGNKRRNAEVVADSVYFGDSKKSSEGNSTYTAPNSYQGSENPYAETMAYIDNLQAQGAQSDFAMLEDDDAQLPF
jgi:single-strand DNA-binding protein